MRDISDAYAIRHAPPCCAADADFAAMLMPPPPPFSPSSR